MKNNQTVYQTKRSPTLDMELPKSKLVKAQRRGHHCLAAAGLQDSETYIEITRGDSTDDDHHRCHTAMAIVQDLYSTRATVRDDSHGDRHTTTTDCVDNLPGGVHYFYGRRRRSLLVKCVWQILSHAYAWGGCP